MRWNQQFFRWLTTRLPPASERRIVTLTGARQVGKTTLARAHWPGLRYVNLDAIEDREALRAVRTSAWARQIGPAVLDEVQKAPQLLDKVKHSYDAGELDFTALLGSSRILLMDRIRESLAGRTFVYELYPLMLSELLHDAAGPQPEPPFLDRLLCAGSAQLQDLLQGQLPVGLGDSETRRLEALEHLGTWGGMPELTRLDDNARRDWLRSYQQTFLERDLADLATLSDLLPFRTLQRLAMLRSGQLLNYAELGRDAGVSSATARRYLEYLRLTYQVVLLQPYRTNLTSGTVKSPKLYWADLGLLRQETRQWGPLSGALFETLAVSEVNKWLQLRPDAGRLWFYRTRSGMEVDLLLETERGLLGIEIKARATVARRDMRGLRALAGALGDRWLGGLVVTAGGAITCLEQDQRLWQVPLHRLI